MVLCFRRQLEGSATRKSDLIPRDFFSHLSQLFMVNYRDSTASSKKTRYLSSVGDSQSKDAAWIRNG